MDSINGNTLKYLK